MIEEAIRKAHFWMPPQWDDLQKSGYATRMVSKFIDSEERDGWQVLARPVVIKINVISVEAGNLWTPGDLSKAFTITPEHPWYDPERDLYIVRAPARREAPKVALEVPDSVVEEYIKKNGLSPNGEWLPGWRV